MSTRTGDGETKPPPKKRVPKRPEAVTPEPPIEPDPEPTRVPPKRDRVHLQFEGRMAMLYRGELDVQDMDEEELVRMQFRDKNGDFTGRPPSNIPGVLIAKMRQELFARARIAREEYYIPAMEALGVIATDEDESASNRLKAIQIILERTEGRVAERIELSTGEKPFEITFARAVRMRRPGGGDDED